MACDAQTVMSDSVMLGEQLPPGMYYPVIISLLCRIAEMPTCDPQTLTHQAECIECAIPVGMQLPVVITLLCQIIAQGGVIQNNNIVGNQDDPNGTYTPPNPTQASFYYKDTPTGTYVSVWEWSVANQYWVPVVT